MLKGLEISILTLSQVLEDNPTIRIDGNYFQKQFINSSLRRDVVKIGEVAIVKSGTTPMDRDDSLTEGVVLLKTTDIRGSVLSGTNTNDLYHISREIADRMQQTQLKPNDVLINIVGATTDVVGRVALVPNDFPEANITQAMALVRLVDKAINPSFLFAFLNGKYGQEQVKRIARPTGQYNLNHS